MPGGSLHTTSLIERQNIDKIAARAEELAAHSWEYGAVSNALIEIYDSSLSPFFGDISTVGKETYSKARGLQYAKKFIVTDKDVLCDGEGSAGDSASLGVAATLLGKLDKAYHAASLRQRNTLLRTTPRFENGAISHRVSVAELWSDFTYMALPFLAFSAFESRDDKLFTDVVRQCALQKEILLDEATGLWCHVIGPEKQDKGLWSSGNGWAVCGLVRVFALLQKYKAALPLKDFPSDLECSLMDTISHILRAAAASDSDETGLLRNYLNDASYFGEVAGTAAICSATFRMSALKPSAVTEREISWAKNAMKIVLSHTGEDGVVTPVANPMNSHDRKPCLKSAEGQAFVLHMIAAHQDWDMLPNTYTDNSMI